MRSKYNIKFKAILPVIIAIIFVIIIESFRFINLFPNYDQSLRYFEHLIAGVVMPYIFHTFEKDSINFSCIGYAFGSFVWEFGQFCMRGYFQLDQYVYDLIGIAFIFFLYNLNDRDQEVI
ncbi:hypothetical protein [Clostridium sp. ZS2-4]|uniref:hypothetical protein n=1 Tax=Clostridium sp. ZS2-4 TaxID=2987703 RepID=UPI00227AB640|nr:hypothetical protein [Clostridium sp. ZS2-4]MCY6355361.1 hypothetical protein [Clostridium sp. ZS2-4]